MASFEALARTGILASPGPGVVRFVPLGGLGEIGKNLALLECGDDVLMIDAGLRFPETEADGVDIILPDISFLLTRLSRLRAVLLTHGHEDHIGALPFYLPGISVPVYGTDVTLGLLRNKLERRGRAGGGDLVTVRPGQTISAGEMKVEFIHMTHSVPGSCGLAIFTSAGLVVHTGDFKLDQTPVGSAPPDLGRLAELGRSGVLLLLSDSTNAPNQGVTPSEVSVRPGLKRAMREAEGRVIVVTFASNLARLRQILEVAEESGRRSCLVGRSMLRNYTTATRLGFLKAPAQGLLSPRDLEAMPHDRICLIATGSQGEPLAALNRIAQGDHRFVTADPNDTVVMAANPIPGNEATVNRLVNRLVSQGVRVLAGTADGVHASGHAASEELLFILSLLAPRFFAPIHGEPRHLQAHRALALSLGITEDRISILENGSVLEAGPAGISLVGAVTTGRVCLDSDGHQAGDSMPSTFGADRLVIASAQLPRQPGESLVELEISAGAGLCSDGAQPGWLSGAKRSLAQSLHRQRVQEVPSSSAVADRIAAELRMALDQHDVTGARVLAIVERV